MPDSRPIRVFAIMEADRITGPAKNLLRFAGRVRGRVDIEVATYLRRADDNGFLQAARGIGLQAHGIAEQGRFDRAVVQLLRERIAASAPDIVQTHNTKSHLLLRLSGVWRQTPWIAFHHGYTAEDWKMRLYNHCDNWSLRTPRRVVTVCEPFVAEMRGRGVERDRIDVVPNGVEPARPLRDGELAGWRERSGAREGEPVLVAIGRLSHEKGHHVLLAALARLRDRPWRLVVAGDGIAGEQLRAQAAAAGIGDRIAWLGLQPDVRPLYSLATVFVLPSLSEGSPNVLLEAMAAGAPSVATAVGGVPETVTDGETALVIPREDPAAMATAIARMLDDTALAARLGAAGRLRAEAFTPDAQERRLLAVYDRVLARS